METKSNNILVGGVTLFLLALLAGFTIWLSRSNDGAKKEYDIFFQQSVNGLAKGSGVTFSGVPVGQIKEIELWGPDPEFVRVRISIDSKVRVLQGTTATINGVGFTGVSEIQLDGAIKGAPPIACPKDNPKSACPAGVAVIPTKPGALGELLNNAPLLVERLATLTERLTTLLSDNNQQSVERILSNTDRLSASLAGQAPELQAAIQDTRNSIQSIGATANRIGLTADEITLAAGNTNTLINKDARAAINELEATMAQAKKSLASLEKVTNNVNPAVETLNSQTLPEVNQLARDLRQLSASLKSVTERLDQQGVGGLVSSPSLPDYDPKKKK